MDHKLAARERVYEFFGRIDEDTYQFFDKINPYIQRFKYIPTILFAVGLIIYAVWYHTL